jgi:hypothetical protein
VTLRNCFGGVRHSIDLNVPFLTHSSDPLDITMNLRALIMLFQRSKLINDQEDEDLMIDIVERFMDQETQYKTARENCMVKLPVLLELQDDESIDLNSSFHEEGKTAINSVMVSGTAPILPEGKEANKTLGKPDEKKNYNLALGEKTSSEQGEQAQGELDPKTVKFAKGESKLESNEQYK